LEGAPAVDRPMIPVSALLQREMGFTPMADRRL
jgi:hypothetical protein